MKQCCCKREPLPLTAGEYRGIVVYSCVIPFWQRGNRLMQPNQCRGLNDSFSGCLAKAGDILGYRPGEQANLLRQIPQVFANFRLIPIENAVTVKPDRSLLSG